jgi:hypothetical protein
MSTETLPSWFWIIYYLFLFITFGTAIFSLIRKKIISLSIIAIVFTITVLIISLLNSIGRAEGINEFEHLLKQLQQGSIWSIYAIIGHFYILVWWVLFFIKSKNKNEVTLLN